MNVIRKRWAPTLFLMFFVVLAGLTLFTNTIRTMTLPKVIAEKAAEDRMTHLVEGHGTVAPKRQDDLVSESGWRVAHVYVKRGDAVVQGQVLVTFDGTELEQMLLDEEAARQKRQLRMGELEEAFKMAMRNGDADAIAKAKRDLNVGQLDEEISQRKIYALRKELEQKKVLAAPYAGIVADIEAREGLRVPQGQKVLTLTGVGEGFEAVFTLQADSAARLALEEEVPVTIQGGAAKRVTGVVTAFGEASFGGASGDGTGGAGASKAQRTVVVTLAGANWKGGEQAAIRIEKPSAEEGVVLRKDYVKRDGKGHYVFLVRETKSSLGNAYYAQKKYVRILDETAEEMVVEGLSGQAVVITESSAPLQDGNPIRL